MKPEHCRRTKSNRPPTKLRIERSTPVFLEHAPDFSRLAGLYERLLARLCRARAAAQLDGLQSLEVAARGPQQLRQVGEGAVSKLRVVGEIEPSQAPESGAHVEQRLRRRIAEGVPIEELVQLRGAWARAVLCFRSPGSTTASARCHEDTSWSLSRAERAVDVTKGGLELPVQRLYQWPIILAVGERLLLQPSRGRG